MVKNTSEFKTLVITQTTWQKDDRNEEGWESYEEKIWMSTPDLFYSQVLNPPNRWLMKPDTSFRSLLIADNEAWVRKLLTHMGINLNAVDLTRVEDTVAYRIGGKDPDVPKILIEKKRFLPLVLTYSFPGTDGAVTITVLFSDYRMIDKGWYPFEITYFDPRGFRESYVIDNLQANMPMDPAVFTGEIPRSEPDQTIEWVDSFQKEKDSETQSVPAID
jgi:hypothetical protein